MSVRADLEVFAVLLAKWNVAQNLVSRETLTSLWPRHIEDSLQLLPLLVEGDRQIVDLGSGGGFPAIPLAIASRETAPQRRFVLLEPQGKKAAFLKTVARELRLPVEVHAVRAEDFDSRETADVVTSRALAPLPALLAMSGPLLKPAGRLLVHKGRTFRAESSQAAQLYDFDMLVHASRTDPDSAILEISKLRAKSAA